MESWRKSLNEQEQINTLGDLRNALQGAARAKEQGLQAAAEKSPAAELVIDLIGPDSIKTIDSAIRQMYIQPDNKKTQTGLDYLNVDDDISAVTDNNVENDFLNNFIKEFDGLPDNLPLVDVDMTKMLSNFIKKNYNQAKLEK